MTSVATGENPLKWDVLVTKRQGVTRDLPPGKEQWMWVPTSATLIYGRRDAVLVDAFLTVEQAHALVERVAASCKNLTTIYLTHGHGDHFFGIGALQNRFPNVRAVAMPDVMKVIRQLASPEYVANFWNVRYPGQIPGCGRSWAYRHRPHDMSARPVSRFGGSRGCHLQRFTFTLLSQTRKPGANGSPRVLH